LAFKVVGGLNGTQAPFEYYLLTDNEGATLGEALSQTSGRLTKCAATGVPEFIAMCDRTAESTSVTDLPVIRVTELLEFSTKSMATVATTVIGTKVTLHTDGLLVTATSSSGVFEISATDGATTTSNVKGYFRR